MKNELIEQFQSIHKKAKDAGLPIFNGIPNHTRAPVIWKGGWEAFVDLAIQAKANILYTEKILFDSEDVEGWIAGTITSLRPPSERGLGYSQVSSHAREQTMYEADDTRDDTVERVWRNLSRWQQHKGKIAAIRCIWVKDAIAHEWSSDEIWWEECRSIIYRTVIEARDERNRAKREATATLHELARKMAQHERFEDAKNDEKRTFMATQLFPTENTEMARKIAELAVLHYWWTIEPAQALDKEEKARQMFQRGEPIANIAAILEMSTAKVKKAVDGVDRIMGKSMAKNVAKANE